MGVHYIYNVNSGTYLILSYNLFSKYNLFKSLNPVNVLCKSLPSNQFSCPTPSPPHYFNTLARTILYL